MIMTKRMKQRWMTTNMITITDKCLLPGYLFKKQGPYNASKR